MPSLWSRRRNRSAEARVREASLVEKRRQSWERLRAQVAAKYSGGSE